MASASRPVRNDAAKTGLFRCTQCDAIFNTEEELRDHEELKHHKQSTDEQDRDRAAGEGLNGEFDQIDGPRYGSEKQE
jgi:hypothetical protein